MNAAKKEDYLYEKAHGHKVTATFVEKIELYKYKVGTDDGNFATRANIRAYIKAVDSGYRFPFYDWCMNNHKADRRRKGSSEREMASHNRETTLAVMLTGWLVWGVALYWVAGQTLSVGACAIAGAILSAVLYRMNRKLAGFTLILLPVIIAAVAGHR